jgi:hypothetical protein
MTSKNARERVLLACSPGMKRDQLGMMDDAPNSRAAWSLFPTIRRTDKCDLRKERYKEARWQPPFWRKAKPCVMPSPRRKPSFGGEGKAHGLLLPQRRLDNLA